MKLKNRIDIKHKFDVTFDGEPSLNVKEVESNGTVGIVPSQFKFIKPKLVVKIGDQVQRGSALFFDKKNPQVYFYSPVSGKIENIVYGPQRRLDLIEISQADDSAIQFPPVDIKKINESQAKSILLERGLWHHFSELPFNNIPTPDKTPPAIIVALSNNEPFHPKISSVINQFERDMLLAINFLKLLTPNVICFADKNEQVNLDSMHMQTQVVRVGGNYPSLEPEAVVYHLKDSIDENKSWVCDWNFLIKLGQSLSTNTYYNKQVICIGGKQKKDNQHYIVTDGIRLNDVFKIKNNNDRIVCGGLFKGLHLDQPKYLPIGIDSVNIIDNNPQIDFLPFMGLGVHKPSFSTAYLGGFLKTFVPAIAAADTRGSLRDCISCGYCEVVCPVDVMPQQTLKHEHVNDVEEMMRFGLLDCSECGACTYVCPSKIDLASKFTDVKDQLYKETLA